MASRCASTVAPALRLHGTRWLSGVPAGLTPASRDAAASAHALTCNADADVLLVLSNDGHSTVVVVAAAPPLFPLEQSDHGLRLHPLMRGAESMRLLCAQWSVPTRRRSEETHAHPTAEPFDGLQDSRTART